MQSKTTVEDCKRFTLRKVLNGPNPGRLSWSRAGQSSGEISYQVEYLNGQPERLQLMYTLTGVKVDYSMNITKTFTPWGSPKYWLLCPDCGRRCGNLYLPPGKQRFVCRLCGDLSYTSCQESGKSNFLIGLLAGMPDLIERYPELTLTELATFFDCELSHKQPPKQITQKIYSHIEKQVLKELRNRPDPYADYLTPAVICERSGLSLADLATLKDARLLVPDHGDLYRPKLASWAGKLAYLLRAGLSMTELKDWTRKRWKAPDPRQWPPGKLINNDQ